MKKCIFCGNEIPDEANFCFSCAGAQTEKREPEPPAPKKKRRILYVCLLAVLAAAAAVAAVLGTGGKTVETGSAEVVYRTGGSVWHVLLRNAASDSFHWQTPQDMYRRVIREELTGAIPLQLYVYDEKTGETRAEELRELLDRSELTITATEGSNAADHGNPEVNPGFPEAARLVRAHGVGEIGAVAVYAVGAEGEVGDDQHLAADIDKRAVHPAFPVLEYTHFYYLVRQQAGLELVVGIKDAKQHAEPLRAAPGLLSVHRADGSVDTLNYRSHPPKPLFTSST